MSWRIEVITPPENEPVTEEEAVAQAKLDAPSDEPNLAIYIGAARAHLEKWLNRGCLITQVIKLTATDAADLKLLPVFPIQSVDAIEIVGSGADALGLFGDLAGTSYPALPLVGDWPGAVALTVTAGFGLDPDDVPADMRLAVLLGITAMIENRGALPADFFDTLRHLLDGHRRPAIA
jgi:uncharacterized phiE125 gp8 family phage protein